MAIPVRKINDALDEIRYHAEIEEFLTVVKGAQTLAVGASVPVPPIKIEHAGRHYTMSGDKITRDS